MAELDAATITRRAVRGFFSLAFVQLVSSVLVFILAGIVEPRTFGVFIVVSASISFLGYFSDIGLAAALIQKKGEITKEDLTTTFTIQQILVLSLVAIGFLATDFVSSWYGLDKEGKILFQVFLISFFLSSLKTIPSVILIREIQFFKISVIQVLETLTLNVVAVFFALQGAGTTSFTYAVLARGVVGVLGIYIISPWNISFGISKKSVNKLLSFGIPIQINSILALAKDDLLTIILGKLLPLSQVGYIGFAQKSAFLPLRLMMDKIIQVTFPAFSRLQEDNKSLTRAVEKTLFSLAFFIFPATVGLAILAPYVISIVPKYNRWEQSLPSLAFFAINAVFSSISTPLTNILNAKGLARITFYFMLFWTVATWVLTLIFIQLMGFLGVSVASAIIASSVVAVIYVAKKHVDFDIVKPISAPFISTIVMGALLYFLSSLFVTNIPTLIIMIILGGALYLGVLFAISKEALKSDLRSLLTHLRHT